MAGIIKDGEHPKVLWPAVKLWYEAAYDPEKRRMVEEIMTQNRPKLTRRQKLLRFFREITWRFSVAFDVLCKGADSKHLDIEY